MRNKGKGGCFFLREAGEEASENSKRSGLKTNYLFPWARSELADLDLGRRGRGERRRTELWLQSSSQPASVSSISLL